MGGSTIVVKIKPSSTVARLMIVYFEMTRVRTHSTIIVIPIHAAMLTIGPWLSSEMIIWRVRSVPDNRIMLK